MAPQQPTQPARPCRPALLLPQLVGPDAFVLIAGVQMPQPKFNQMLNSNQ